MPEVSWSLPLFSLLFLGLSLSLFSLFFLFRFLPQSHLLVDPGFGYSLLSCWLCPN